MRDRCTPHYVQLRVLCCVVLAVSFFGEAWVLRNQIEFVNYAVSQCMRTAQRRAPSSVWRRPLLRPSTGPHSPVPAFTDSSDQRATMANAAPASPDILCAGAIAFLHLLHPVPVEPSINTWQQQSYDDPAAYSLPFNKERDFVNTLAFLSNIGEDPNHIPALCMHETPRLVGSEVIIAVN